MTFLLSPGQAHVAPKARVSGRAAGRKLLRRLGRQRANPPLKTRREPWEHDRESYRRRNEIEHLFRRLKGFRRIVSRFEKLNALSLGFIHFALIYDALR